MSLKDSLRKISEGIDVSKKVPKGYFNQKVFYGCIVVLVLYFFAALFTNGWSGKYNCCPSTANMCVNAEYNPSCGAGQECSVQYMKPGECFGQKPNWLAEGGEAIVVIIVALSFAMNHSLWARRGLFGR